MDRGQTEDQCKPHGSSRTGELVIPWHDAELSRSLPSAAVVARPNSGEHNLVRVRQGPTTMKRQLSHATNMRPNAFLFPFVVVACFSARNTIRADVAVHVHDDRLQLSVFAVAPDIVTPIGMAIDDRDHLFVLESHTHLPANSYPGPKGDLIKRFTDWVLVDYPNHGRGKIWRLATRTNARRIASRQRYAERQLSPAERPYRELVGPDAQPAQSDT